MPNTLEQIKERLGFDINDQGLNLRPNGTRKGKGFLGGQKVGGKLADTDAVASEFSVQSDAVTVDGKRIDFPTFVPTLTKEELNLMLNDIIPNKKLTPEPIMRKAIDHANKRISEGKSVFAGRSIDDIKQRLGFDKPVRAVGTIKQRLGFELTPEEEQGIFEGKKELARSRQVFPDVLPTVPPLREFTFGSTKFPVPPERRKPTLEQKRIKAGIPVEKDIPPQTAGESLMEFFRPTLAFIGAPITIPANVVVGLIKDVKGVSSKRNVDAIKRIATLRPTEGDELFVGDVLREFGITDESTGMPEGTIDRIGLVGDFAAFGGVDKLARTVAKVATSGKPVKTFVKEVEGAVKVGKEIPKVAKPPLKAVEKIATEITEKGAGINPFKILPKSIQTKAQEFWSPFSTLPKPAQVLAARSAGRGAVRRGEDFIGKLKKRIDVHPLEVRKEIFKYLDDTIDLTDLPINARGLAKSLKNAQIRIGKALVKRGLLSEEAFTNLRGKYVHYIYAKNILGDVGIDPARIMTPTGKLDMSYLKSRNPNLTAIDKQALGLIEDAGIAVPVGMGKSLTDIAKFDYLEKLTAPVLDLVWEPSTIKIGAKRWGISKLASEVQKQSNLVATNAKKGIVNEPAIERLRVLGSALEEAKRVTGKVPEGFRQIPDSAKFGNLAGAFVRKPIFDDIMPLVTPLSSNAGAGRLLQTFAQFNAQVTGLFKAGKVALNPPTMFRNSVSNILQNNMRGRTLTAIPKDFLSAVKSMIKKDEHWITAKRTGLFESNWTVGELNQVLQELNSVNASSWSTFLNFIGKISKFYGKIDDLAKFTIYKQLRTSGKLNRFGIGTGKVMPVDDAILEAQKWGMDYSLASRSVKHLRRQILPFGTYQYKIAPLILESLQKRPWIIGKYMAFLGIGGFSVAQELVKSYFDVSDKEWDKLLKQLPQYIKRNQTFAPLPWKSPEGQWQWVNGEYFMPWGTWSTVIRDMSQREGFEAFKSAGIGNPLLSVFQMITSAGTDKPPIDPFTKQPIWNQLDTPQSKFLKLSSWLSNQLMPSVFENLAVQDAPRQGALGTTIRAIESKVKGEPFKDKWGRTLTPEQALGKWFGFNITTISPKQTKIIKFSRIKTLRKELIKKLLDPRVSKESKQQAKKRYIEGIQNIRENE